MIKGTITGICAPYIIAEGIGEAGLYDTVQISHLPVRGEIVDFDEGSARIQLFDRSEEIKLGKSVRTEALPLCAELGPGLLGRVLDGIGRPIDGMGEFALDRETVREFKSCVKVGDEVSGGDTVGFVRENDKIVHKVMVPFGVRGTVKTVIERSCRVDDMVVAINGADNTMHEISMMQRWPVRRMRPYSKRLLPIEPLVSRERGIDALFPIVTGSITSIAGGYGTGKTTLAHRIASSIDVDVFVYVGCGKRGNEMKKVLDLFANKEMAEKSVIVATTSDMTAGMRTASLYTAVTIAEYYRDMGYKVALMADSISDWADSLSAADRDENEITNELSRIYERVGRVAALGQDYREGSVTFITATSAEMNPATLRSAKVLLTLDENLAEEKFFPAIDFSRSYSLYAENTRSWFNSNVNDNWAKYSAKFAEILQRDSEIIENGGTESDEDRLIERTAACIYSDFICQNETEEPDGCELDKQYKLMRLIYDYYRLSTKALKEGADIELLVSVPALEEIANFKYTADKDLGSEYRKIIEHLNSDIQKASAKEGE